MIDDISAELRACSRWAPMRLSLICAWILAAGCAPGRSGVATPPEPINTESSDIAPDHVADSLLVEIRSLAPTIVTDLRYATANNFTGAPLAGYLANRAYLRREAAAALARVQIALRSRGLGLKVFDAYRPARATAAMVEWTRRVNRGDLLEDGYIASRSRHNLGVAIDLTLIDLATGRELDMGTPFDTFSAAAHTANATGLVATNRQLLKSEMEREGFTNYDQEWWHYSYTVPNPLRFDRPVR
jgi:zinc D-Ala-D-Ala dipeptidase